MEKKVRTQWKSKYEELYLKHSLLLEKNQEKQDDLDNALDYKAENNLLKAQIDSLLNGGTPGETAAVKRILDECLTCMKHAECDLIEVSIFSDGKLFSREKIAREIKERRGYAKDALNRLFSKGGKHG